MIAEEKMSYLFLQSVGEKRIQELELLRGSPFFVHCELELTDGSGKHLDLYIGRFGFFEEQIYSWVAPVATIRFDAPGEVSYQTPKGERRHALMRTKEQFMVVDGRIVFYAREELGHSRELVHQEHFTRKEGFVLPEIVAQMERAQDAVIRAHHVGPFAISGPAGSGKTTLALHRVAYLTQAPDTAEFYPGHKSVVFVQDNGTKDYFTHLLPELGITNVAITTFAEWAMKTLDLPGYYGYAYTERFGGGELNEDRYELAKLRALRQSKPARFTEAGYKLLWTHYEKHFNPADKLLFAWQTADKLLDRFDLTIMLRSLLATKKKFVMEYESYYSKNGAELKKMKEKREIQYNLVVVDEFQNYLPESLAVLQRCAEPERRTMLYVGDLAQRVRLGTVQGWEELGETIHTDRRVVLEKVYRNTKRILEYIRALGYAVEIPASLREGELVREVECGSPTEEIAYIKKLLATKSEGLIGVLAKNADYLEPFRETFRRSERVHVSTMAEAQGVEFERVVIVGIRPDLFSTAYARALGPDFEATKARIYRDLLYVALTRAMNELHVLGRCSLKEALL